MKQLPDVGCSRGAPMGRRDSPALSEAPRSVRLFRLWLDRGGYDDGGAYWGHGETLYCAQDDEGNRQFVRARTRAKAALLLNIPGRMLKVRMNHEACQYGIALIDGHAPMPQGETRESVILWMQEHGARMGQKIKT